MLGSSVVAPLIKNKKYRKDLTDFVDLLRLSPNFRDRQMYITVAEAAFKADKEIYKKHFAKAIGNEMRDEKVAVVQMMIAKLCGIVPKGYSRSTDIIADVIRQQKKPEVMRFFDETNEHLQDRRFLDPSKFKLKLKDDTEPVSQLAADKLKKEETKDGEFKPNPDEEAKEIASVEKNVNIRFCNYSMLVRASQFSSPGLSS